MTLAHGLSLAGGDSAALHFEGGAAQVLRLPVNSLSFKPSVVYPLGDPSLIEGRVHGLRPGSSPALQHLFSVPVPSFVPKSAVLERTEGEEDVGVGVSLVGMDGHVCGHPLLDTVDVHPPLQKPNVSREVQFFRKGELDLPGELGVMTLFGGLHGVPKGGSVLSPGGGPVGRQDDFVGNRLAAGVVPDHPLAMVGEHISSSIGRRRHGGPAGAAADDLGGEAVDGHGDDRRLWVGGPGAERTGTRH